MHLRGLRPADAPAVRRIYSGRSVADLWFGQMTAAQAHDYVREAQEADAHRPRTARVLGIDVHGDLIGIVRLRITGHTGSLSYILREDTWGHGYATTAVRRFLAHHRTPRVTAEHRVGNPASGRVLTKTGFVVTTVTDEIVRYELG
ncbi:GNAT family N-acetyltransferase [Kitasatospora sp. NPDC059812]|uniref:GNAT family N-acetyltransferase n=1 Tax=unclassified Kitasatospora TaxID=2633591 RepID=UPI00364F34C9